MPGTSTPDLDSEIAKAAGAATTREHTNADGDDTFAAGGDTPEPREVSGEEIDRAIRDLASGASDSIAGPVSGSGSGAALSAAQRKSLTKEANGLKNHLEPDVLDVFYRDLDSRFTFLAQTGQLSNRVQVAELYEALSSFKHGITAVRSGQEDRISSKSLEAALKVYDGVFPQTATGQDMSIVKEHYGAFYRRSDPSRAGPEQNFIDKAESFYTQLVSNLPEGSLAGIRADAAIQAVDQLSRNPNTGSNFPQHVRAEVQAIRGAIELILIGEGLLTE